MPHFYPEVARPCSVLIPSPSPVGPVLRPTHWPKACVRMRALEFCWTILCVTYYIMRPATQATARSPFLNQQNNCAISESLRIRPWFMQNFDFWEGVTKTWAYVDTNKLLSSCSCVLIQSKGGRGV